MGGSILPVLLYYYFCYIWDAHDAIVAKQVPAYKYINRPLNLVCTYTIASPYQDTC